MSTLVTLMMWLAVIAMLGFVAIAIASFFIGWVRSESGRATAPLADETTPTVRLDGEVLMMTHDGLHHPVGSHVAVTTGRTFLGSTIVGEDNAFSLDIPAHVRGEIEVSLGMHGGSVSLVTADGNDLHAVVIYNPVNNYFA